MINALSLFLRTAFAFALFTGLLPGTLFPQNAKSQQSLATATPQEIRAKLKSVKDGDSFVAQTDSGTLEIRINGIDAPEHQQAYAAQARRFLQESLQGKELKIVPQKRDQYQRTIAQVWFKPKADASYQDFGLMQIESGFAWHYKRYAKEQDFDTRLAYTRAEEAARQKRLGLWRDLDSAEPPVAPWDYRRAKR